MKTIVLAFLLAGCACSSRKPVPIAHGYGAELQEPALPRRSVLLDVPHDAGCLPGLCLGPDSGCECESVEAGYIQGTVDDAGVWHGPNRSTLTLTVAPMVWKPTYDITVTDENGRLLITDPGGANRVCDAFCVPGGGGTGWGPHVRKWVVDCLRRCMDVNGVREP